MTKLILSIDGGGIRGAAAARFVELLDDQLQKDHQISLRDKVDFYAGTSTGSLIALALATTDMTPKQISDLYGPATAAKIFTENRGLFEIDGINAPKYEGEPKTKVLASKLGKAKLSNVPRDKHVLAVAYDVEARRPAVFKSTDKEHRKLKSADVADASSAAPTYFPTKELKKRDEEDWLVDGGVTANNPTMCAIAEARRTWPEVGMDALRVISIGSGYQTRKINGPASRNWGAIGWVTRGSLLDLLTDERVVAYQAVTLMSPGTYIRINAEMRRQPGLPKPPDDAMDDISRQNINKLKTMGEFWFDQYGSQVVELIMGTYTGPSLDRIDPETGKPIKK